MSESLFKGATYEVATGKPGVFNHVFTFPEMTMEEVVKSLGGRHVTLATTCPACRAEMRGDWYGEPPYTLLCDACGERYTVIYSDQGGPQKP